MRKVVFVTWLWVLASVALCVSLVLTAHVRRARMRRPQEEAIDWMRVRELEQEIYGENFDHAGEPEEPAHLSDSASGNPNRPVDEFGDIGKGKGYDFGGPYIHVIIRGSVLADAYFIVNGVGSRIDVHGSVARGAIVTARGSNAVVTVYGRIDAGAQVTAAGRDATVITHGPVHPQACVTWPPGH